MDRENYEWGDGLMIGPKELQLVFGKIKYFQITKRARLLEPFLNLRSKFRLELVVNA